ncbi:hypothetical protein [Pseudomonas petrae]|uniref:Uncharacterized protein n=1 Tax=Pseudomonas petrae TaxID=2912190 RepID=A0ABS9I897_9PSED|nr:hypothetical protein [Pseudomonas petrae]MCF7534111.1 hypothetical protein [Pseudomonas petrae]MCF7538039.1 hypothetical protein [Pseudomonas petrae]MCF7543318.1 hypothetical protein [Pseudomonas petrae]MCF7555402.1 hypothetical protein [Pseudomonas petrae]
MTHSIIPLPVNFSRWTYETASSGGLTIAFAAGSGGSITLKTPDGKEESFRYGGLGAGIGFGARLPRFGKVNLNIKGKSVGGVGALESFRSKGWVLVSDALKDRDLTRDDITGACVFLEIGLGLGAGGSSTAMLFGLDPKLLALTLALNAMPAASAFAPQITLRHLLQSAKGAVVMAGFNVGVQAGVGGAIYLGGLF